MFGGMDPLVQGFGGVLIEHRDRLLGDDRAGIDPGIR